MDKTKMALWLYLLDNTKLPQANGMLGSPSFGMCCMGVANSFLFLEPEYSTEGFLGYDQNVVLGLDKQVTEEEGKHSKEYMGRNWYGNNRMHVLSLLNDSYDYTFRQIADFIREMGWDKE